MKKEKQIEEMANDINKHCVDLSYTECGAINCTSCLANALYNAGYRKVEQGECEYCKTGGEKCQTCTEFYKNIDDRCSGYDDGKCIEYTPVKYCFNCGAKMKGAE